MPLRPLIALFFALAAAVDNGDRVCALPAPDSAAAKSASCLACHTSHGQSGNHPVDLQYERVGNEDQRGAAEAIRRGILLPEGQIRCVTCHDARSPWKDHLALPPGSRAVPAVNPFDRATYDGRPREPLKPGDAVSPKPLCLACHALD